MAKVIQRRIKAHPAPDQNLQWQPNGGKSLDPVTCNGCGEKDLHWSWDFYARESCLVSGKYGERHQCQTPRHAHDIFPGWCVVCPAQDLSWVRKKDGFELTESYGLPHTCQQPIAIKNVGHAKCRYCKTQGLFWITTIGKSGRDQFTLTTATGSKHTCMEFDVVQKDFAEAKRMDYAREKAWMKSIPDGTECKKCKGTCFISYMSKSKKLLAKFGKSEPIEMRRPCLKCKQMGTFTAIKKAEHLKDLRKRYWPYKGHHKWKKADRGE